jgi:hypothetical protein
MQNLRACVSKSLFTFQAQVLDLKLNAFFQEWVLLAVSEICQEEEKKWVGSVARIGGGGE